MKVRLYCTEIQFSSIVKKIGDKNLSLHLRNQILSKFRLTAIACEPCTQERFTKHLNIELSEDTEAALKSEACRMGLTPSEYVKRIFIEPLLLE